MKKLKFIVGAFKRVLVWLTFVVLFYQAGYNDNIPTLFRALVVGLGCLTLALLMFIVALWIEKRK